MQVFFVRHGETGGNVARRHQVAHTPLSPEGRQQAEVVAEQIKSLKPTHLVSSNLVRAVETAGIIGRVCGLVPETSYHFVELDRPAYLYGHHHRSMKSIWFYMQWYFGRGSGKGEGESYKVLRQRIQAAQRHLAQYPDDARVVVVSHSVFITMFAAHACRGGILNPIQAAKTFLRVLTMPNAHITKMSFKRGDERGTCTWSVDTSLECL